MTAFKEQVKADRDTFLNLDEFADPHEINGKTYTCILQSPEEQEKFFIDNRYDGFEDIHGELLVIHIKEDDFGERPAEGEILKVDEEPCVVDKCIADMGILTITLHKHHM